jgi:hypothetical protein
MKEHRLLCYGTTLEEAVSWVNSGAFSCMALNDMLSSSLLEELAVITYSQRENKWKHLHYIGDYQEFSILQIFNIYATNELIVIYFYQRDNVFNPELTTNLCN